MGFRCMGSEVEGHDGGSGGWDSRSLTDAACVFKGFLFGGLEWEMMSRVCGMTMSTHVCNRASCSCLALRGI